MPRRFSLPIRQARTYHPSQKTLPVSALARLVRTIPRSRGRGHRTTNRRCRRHRKPALHPRNRHLCRLRKRITRHLIRCRYLSSCLQLPEHDLCPPSWADECGIPPFLPVDFESRRRSTNDAYWTRTEPIPLRPGIAHMEWSRVRKRVAVALVRKRPKKVRSDRNEDTIGSNIDDS